MIIAATILFSLLLTLVIFGLQDCFTPINRYLVDRLGEMDKPNPCVPFELTPQTVLA